jgi:nucleotide-binding universal stress UspA family protein
MKDRLMELMIKEGNEALGEIEDKARDVGVAYESCTRQGDPGEELLKLCQEMDFDLIVLGCIGRSGLEKLLLGSVAERVVRHANIPVLVVPARAEGEV